MEIPRVSTMAHMFLKWPPVEASLRPLNQCFLQGPSDPSEASIFFSC